MKRKIIYFAICFIIGFVLGSLSQIINNRYRNYKNTLNNNVCTKPSLTTPVQTDLSCLISQYVDVYTSINENNKYDYIIDDNIITLIIQNVSKDFPFIVSLLPQYLEKGIMFIPKNNLFSDVLKNAKIYDNGYIKNLFDLGHIRIYNYICSILYERQEFWELSLLTTEDYYYKGRETELEVTYKNILEIQIHQLRLEEKIDISFLRLGKWLENIYHPLIAEDILNYKSNNKINKDDLLHNEILADIDNKILLSDGDSIHISILDYLIITRLNSTY